MKTFEGWYCAHCQRGVDASEVTFHEQHTACGRTITDDTPLVDGPVAAPQRESVTVRYDLSPAQTESAIRDALIRMGWTPPEGESVATVKAERDALRAESADLRERVKELEADAKRWHFVRQFMFLDDVGDEDFCLGLITHEESLSERVTPAASRLYKDRWDARCRAEYQGEELDQGEITVDEAIDAAMQEWKS